MSFVTKKPYLALIFCLIVAWAVYTRAYAPRETLRILEYYQLDAIMHFWAGFWFMGILCRFSPWKLSTRLWALLIAVLSWEILEFALFPDTRHLYTSLFHYWLRDTLADAIAGLAGGLVAVWAERFSYRSSGIGHKIF